jgi:hypothetical protein
MCVGGFGGLCMDLLGEFPIVVAPNCNCAAAPPCPNLG